MQKFTNLQTEDNKNDHSFPFSTIAKLTQLYCSSDEQPITSTLSSGDFMGLFINKMITLKIKILSILPDIITSLSVGEAALGELLYLTCVWTVWIQLSFWNYQNISFMQTFSWYVGPNPKQIIN